MITNTYKRKQFLHFKTFVFHVQVYYILYLDVCIHIWILIMRSSYRLRLQVSNNSMKTIIYKI